MSNQGTATGATDGAADDAEGTGELDQFISFAIGDEQYGVDIMAVREIKGWSTDQPACRTTGLCARRAQPARRHRPDRRPALPLRTGHDRATPLHIVIVVQIGGRQVGLLADRVLDIVDVEVARVQPVPRIAEAARTDFLSGLVNIDSGMVALIDLSRLLAMSIREGADLEPARTGHRCVAAQPSVWSRTEIVERIGRILSRISTEPRPRRGAPQSFVRAAADSAKSRLEGCRAAPAY